MSRCPLLLCTLLLVLTTAFACNTSRQTHGQLQATVTSKEFKLDTIGSNITVYPDKDCILRLTNVVAYVISDTIPSVSLSIYPPSGEPKRMLLPYIQNMGTFSFGGGIRYAVTQGGKAVIEIYNGISGAPLPAKIIVWGVNEK